MAAAANTKPWTTTRPAWPDKPMTAGRAARTSPIMTAPGRAEGQVLPRRPIATPRPAAGRAGASVTPRTWGNKGPGQLIAAWALRHRRQPRRTTATAHHGRPALGAAPDRTARTTRP